MRSKITQTKDSIESVVEDKRYRSTLKQEKTEEGRIKFSLKKENKKTGEIEIKKWVF